IPRPITVPHIFPHPGHAGGTGDVNWPVLLSIVGGVAAIAVGVYWYKHRPSSVRVRIVTIPPGEAPEEVRRAWVGLELPLIVGQVHTEHIAAQQAVSHQAVNAPNSYAVEGRAAVAILEAASPDAAAWWRQNAPHVLASGYQLIFPADVCERLDDLDAGLENRHGASG